MKRSLIFAVLLFSVFAYAKTEKTFDVSKFKFDSDVCIKNLTSEKGYIRVIGDVENQTDLMISNIEIGAYTQVNYKTVISDKMRKLYSITVTTDLNCEIYVKEYDENLVIELTKAGFSDNSNDAYSNNSYCLNEGNILDYWYVNGNSKRKSCRDKVFITNYSKDKNIVFKIYGVLQNKEISKIGTVAVSDKYVTNQVFLDVPKIENFSEFLIVPQNNKKYKFYASSNHGDMYIYFEDEEDSKIVFNYIKYPNTTSGIPDSEGNYLINPQLDNESLSDGTGWMFVRENSANGKIEISSNEAVLKCTRVSSIPTDLQLCQLGISLKGNHKYVVSFEAYG